MNILRIAARVAIRSKTFNLAEFKNLESAKDKLDYANKHLKRIGVGSSRAVFEYSSSKVLKVANHFRGSGTQEAGIAQNKAEIDAYTNPKLKPVTTKIFDYDPNFHWIISEAVRGLVSQSEFKKYSGINSSLLLDYLQELENGETSVDEIFEDAKDQKIRINKEFFEGVLSLIDNGILAADIARPDHWGKTSDGRIVILDYGFDREVEKIYYPSEEDVDSGAETSKPT